ncbi:MAG TPA: alpha-E domain-containing protein, partial [Myxococcales bacterium]|nr:alpha-E domain-containing protein [Myxococcales bacterium]
LEAWEALNELHLWMQGPRAAAEYDQERFVFYRRVRNAMQLTIGLLRSTMLHDTPLDFIWLGVILERASQTARILDVHHHAMTSMELHRVVQAALWLSILRACSGFEPFMKRNQGRVTRDAVAAFLILEPQFPRSVRYCVRQGYQTLCAIRPPAERDLPGGVALERLRVLDHWLSEIQPTALEAGNVHELLTHVVDETSGICADVGRELLS